MSRPTLTYQLQSIFVLGGATFPKVGEARSRVGDFDRSDGECQRLGSGRPCPRISILVSGGDGDEQAPFDGAGDGAVKREVLV